MRKKEKKNSEEKKREEKKNGGRSQTIHSGLEKSESKPKVLQSSFEILLKISRTWSGVKSTLDCAWASSSFFSHCSRGDNNNNKKRKSKKKQEEAINQG